MQSKPLIGLKTQYAMVVAFLVVFTLGASASHWVRSRSQAALLISLHEDIAIATKLPRLKAQLRRLDLVTSQYLQTGKASWLEEHMKTLEELRQTQEDLVRLFPKERERSLVRELNRQLADHFKDESRWFRQKQVGRLRPEEAARLLAMRRNYEDILEIVLTMHDVGLKDISGLVWDSERASRQEFALVLLAGLMASGALAFALSRYIIRPISSLTAYAADWKPGQPWTCEAPAASPEITGLFVHVKQLVERFNRLYRKQLDMNQLKSKFVALVSHELNNALSVIHAASFNLEESDAEAGNEKRQKMYRMIRRQTRALSMAIANLLNTGRLESGKLALHKKKMEMAAVLKASLELLEPLLDGKSLKITLSLPDTSATVFADPDALTLVSTNLLSNAIKYTPEGGAVTVGIAHHGVDARFVHVYIKDTGIGIRPEERERIFSGFYRSEAAQRAGRGYGIGLSLVKSIIEAHGGRLELESQPGKGSTFSFLLPLWTAELDGKESSASQDIPAEDIEMVRT